MLLAPFCGIGPALAQQSQSNNAASAHDSAEAEAPVLQEVLVSARKITERIQDVPASIAALDASALQNGEINSLQDIGRAVPGVNIVSSGPGRNQLIIRGLSSSGGQSMVGYYIDDTPIVGGLDIRGTSSADPFLGDLARVEVLRGPQGTLYGASSMGGTIKYVTEQPDLHKFSGSTQIATSYTEMARGPSAGLTSILNVPVVNDFIAVRASGFYRYNHGYIDRYAPAATDILALAPGGPLDTDVNTERTFGGRVAVRVQPTAWLTITPSAFIQKMRLGGEFSFDYPQSTFQNPLQVRSLAEPSEDDETLYALNVHADFDKWSITSSTSYYSRINTFWEDDSKETYAVWQPAQTSVYPTPFYLDWPNHNFTEELRASFKVGRFDGVVGGFYSRVVGKAYYNWPVQPGYYDTFGNIFDGETTFYQGGVDSEDRQRALFTELHFAITDKLTATVGGRQFSQFQDQKLNAAGVLQGGVPLAKDVTAKANGFTPKYGLSYAFTSDLMTYLTASKGFREGGTFVPIPEEQCRDDLAAIGLQHAPNEFRPDSLWNYELGAKSQWLDRRLTVNAAVYYIKWKDVQQQVSLVNCGFSFTGNFGSATSKGGELEVDYTPIDPLRFGLQLAYNQAQLTATVVGTDGVAGQALTYAPRWTGSASAEYKREIIAGVALTSRVDVNTSSREYRNYDPTRVDYLQPPYTLVNARLGADFGSWEMAVVGTNVLDRRAATAPESTYSLFLPDTYRVSLQRPRTVGIEFTVHY
jgi:outer membrane receptor protein involved in Fe transport